MKTINTISYQCDICRAQYDTRDEALLCEQKPISQDKGVKVGDIITITKGDGAGKKAKVTERYILTKDWGHYVWERYWHTVALVADIIDEWGSRNLTFDDYEV